MGEEGAVILGSALKHMPHLRTLDIGYNNISSHGMLSLSDNLIHCSNISTLNICNNNIGKGGTKTLANIIPQCKKLHTLDISGNNITFYLLLVLLTMSVVLKNFTHHSTILEVRAFWHSLEYF